MADNKMTPELRELLLNRLPFSRNSSLGYTPKAYLTKTLDENGKETEEFEIPEEYRPVFTIRPMTAEEKAKLSTNKPEEKVLRDITRSNIINVIKLYDAGSMEEISFKSDAKGGMDKDQFESIPNIVILDLFRKISSISGLSPHERSGL